MSFGVNLSDFRGLKARCTIVRQGCTLFHESHISTTRQSATMDSVAVDVSSIDLEPAHTDIMRRVSSSLGLASSPSKHSPSFSRASGLSRVDTPTVTKHLKPFHTEDIKILLLENVNQTGIELLQRQGYQVTILKSSLAEDELIEKIRCGNAKSFQHVCESSLMSDHAGRYMF